MSSLRIPPPRRTASPGNSGSDAPESRDAIVQQTDQDASQSRLSAVQTGYLNDEFAVAFVASKGQRRYPLINRGTYVRTTAIDMLVNSFLTSTPGKKQIVSLGAGSDTRFFRLKQQQQTGIEDVIYHEFDFAAVTSNKIAAILRDEPRQLLRLVGDIVHLDHCAGSLSSSQYHVHPVDLRSLHPGCSLPPSVDTSLPTLFLSECCLIYLSPPEADSILQWCTRDFSSAVGIILYEPIGGEDAFGKVMIQNLQARGIVLRTLKRYSTLARQKERLRMLGFTAGQRSADIDYIHDHWISEAERERIAVLEMLDEVEEWQLLARHYCLAYGWKDAEGETSTRFLGWQDGFPVQNSDT